MRDSFLVGNVSPSGQRTAIVMAQASRIQESEHSLATGIHPPAHYF
jgi:hypothetical protein